MSATLVLLALLTGPLDALESRLKAAEGANGRLDPAVAREVAQGVKKLIGQDKLTSGEDFRRAAALWRLEDNDFEDARIKYELVLVAVALDDSQARTMLKGAWDALQVSMGRPQRFGSMLEAPETPRQPYSPVPACVLGAYGTPPFRASGSAASDNAEVKQIVDADQAARQGDFSKFTVKQIEEMIAGDRKRLARIKEIVEGPDLRTSNDFFNAALTMQHGSTVMDIVMAHELAVSSVLLGDKATARWLAAASYDRMLRYGGHRQRFATQYNMSGLQRTDTDAFNDRMRKALRCPTLSQAKKRVFK